MAKTTLSAHVHGKEEFAKTNKQRTMYLGCFEFSCYIKTQ